MINTSTPIQNIVKELKTTGQQLNFFKKELKRLLAHSPNSFHVAVIKTLITTTDINFRALKIKFQCIAKCKK